MGLPDEWRAWKQEQLPIGRFGQTGEIAPTALLLASDSRGGHFSLVYC